MVCLKRNLLAGTGLAVALAVALSVVPMGTALAEESGDEIIAKYIEAIGGEAALAKIKNRVTKSTFSLPDMGMEGASTAYAAPPNAYSKTSFDAFGDVESGLKDGVAWSVSPMQGSSILEGQQKRQALRQASLNPLGAWKETFEKAECVGEETVDDTACWKVVMTPKEGESETLYFAKDSGLLLKMETPGEMGMTSEIYPSDYKEVDGIKIAHKTEIDGGQFLIEITIDSIEHNVDIPADRFDLPDEIKQLLEPASSEESSPEGSDSQE